MIMKRQGIVLWLFVLSVIVIIPAFTAYAQDVTAKSPISKGSLQQINKYFSTQTTTYNDGTTLNKSIINGPPKPPPGYELEHATVSLPEPRPEMGINTLTVPAFRWVFGCSAVSGAMIAGYHDRNGFSNIYTGPTNGGTIPLQEDSSWTNWIDSYGDTYPNNPLIASHNGLDGRVGRGSIDDYWVGYFSSSPDPYITGSWTQHAWGDAIGDYMKTSQSAFDNVDGSTSFYGFYSSANPLTCSAMENYGIHDEDGTYGRKLFYEARGYTVTDCYSQMTDNNYSGGFSFAQYKAEIDAGRPVLLNLEGHSIVGFGYDDSSSTVYIHNTWNNSYDTMTWGGSYAGMPLLSVSIVNMEGLGPATGVTITPDKSSPRPVGTGIIFTAAASGGSGSYEYYFGYRNPSGTWTDGQAYSTKQTWNWNTTGLPAGVYTVQVWARNAGSSASYEAYNGLSYTLTIGVTLTPDKGSPQPVGTGITFTAAASGGSGSYQYYFTYRNPSGTWTAAQAYSTKQTWNWNTTGLTAGVYTVQVWARNAGSSASYEAWKGLTYTLTVASSPSPVSNVTLTTNSSSPQPVGTSITFTATASGGSGSYQYYFTYRNPSGTWTAAQAYSTKQTWDWNTTGLTAGVYTVQVWARNAGSSASYEAWKGLTYTLTVASSPSPVSNVTLTTNSSSPQPVGTSITFTATASGGSGSYEYYFTYRNPSGTWTAAQAYSTTQTWNWNTTGLPAGVYSIQVWARNAGSTASYEAWKGLTYTLR